MHLLCTGASARGLGNIASRTGYGARVTGFLRALAALPQPPPVLFVFGQVDVEFVFTFKRLEGRAPDFAAFCAETVSRYVGFLAAALPDRLRPRAEVAAVFPPALNDLAWRDGYVNAHIAELHGQLDPASLSNQLKALQIPSLRERTAQHALFNRMLEEKCLRDGLGFVDTFTPLLSNGVADPSFLGPSAGADHHLGWRAVREPIVDLLWRCVLRDG